MPPKRRNKSAPVVNPADSPSHEDAMLALQQGIDPGLAARSAHPGVFREWEAHFKATGSSSGFTPSPCRSPQAGLPVSESSSQQNTPTQANFITSGLAEHARIESSILKWPHEASPRTPSPPAIVAPPPQVDHDMAPASPSSSDSDIDPIEAIHSVVDTFTDAGRLADLSKAVFEKVYETRSVHNTISTIDESTSLDRLLLILLDLFRPNTPLPHPTPNAPPPAVPAVEAQAALRAPEKSPVRKKVKASAPTPPKPQPPPAAVKPKAVALKSHPAPQDAPPISVAKARPCQRRATHTTRGLTRKGIYLTPPAGSTCNTASFTPEVINSFNSLIGSDLQAKGLDLLTAHESGGGIFIDATRTPTSALTGVVLKHVRRLFPASNGACAIDSIHPTSTSFLKLFDVPITAGPPTEWANLTREALKSALAQSLVGKIILDNLKHRPRIMCVSPHSDSCIAWIDLHDTQSGSTAASLIGKHIRIGEVNCRIADAKPHPGSIVCTQCTWWGHHHSQCRSQSVCCPLCGGPHSEANHTVMVKVDRVDHRHCINCTSANRFRLSDKQRKTSHASSDHKCLFWSNRFNRGWLKKQFKSG
jgi:hypothetical protein